MRILQAILFLVLFLGIMYASNYYVLQHLAKLAGISKTLWFFVGVGVIAFSYIIATILERLASNMLTRGLYFLSSLWLGVLLLLLALFLLVDGISLFTTLPGWSHYAVLGIALVVTVFSVFNASQLQVKEVVITSPLVEKETTIVQLTDVHIGSTNRLSYLEKVVTKTNALHPDVVVITGDLFDNSEADGEAMSLILDKIEAPAYFVTGNHETYIGLKHVKEIMDNSKVITLDGNVEQVAGIEISGLAYDAKSTIAKRVQEIEFSKDKFSLYLLHEPIYFEEASKQGVNLMLSGHTHNGQIFPFTLLVRLAYAHTKGLYEKDGAYLYVSPGTGTWGPYMRFGSNNEITKIVVRSE